MRKTSIIILWFVFQTSFVGSSQNSFPKDNELLAKKFVEYLSQQKYKKAYAMFAPSISSKIQVENLQETWQDVEKKIGKFKQYTKIVPYREGQGMIVYCIFEKKDMNIKLAFNDNKQIQGFFFVDPQDN